MKTAVIITAPHCMAATYQYLCQGLPARFGPLAFEHRTEQDLLGGFLIQLDGMVYDCTLRTRLRQLRQCLTDGKER